MLVRNLLTRLRPLPVALGLSVIAIAVAFTLSGTTEPIDSFAACAEAGYPVTDTNPPLCRVDSTNYLGTPVAATVQAAPSTSVPFDILVDGDTHAATPPHGQTLITNQADWQHYWAQAHVSLAQLPPLIPVDFTTSNVIATSFGMEANTGYELKITSINSSTSGSTVDITESTPTITCPITQTPTNRYLIVRTPIIAQPTSYRITSEMRHCP